MKPHDLESISADELWSLRELSPRYQPASQYRLIGRWRAFLYLIRNSFFVSQVEQAFWFEGFHRFDYSLSTGLVSS
jgi:hypothetical protein